MANTSELLKLAEVLESKLNHTLQSHEIAAIIRTALKPEPEDRGEKGFYNAKGEFRVFARGEYQLAKRLGYDRETPLPKIEWPQWRFKGQARRVAHCEYEAALLKAEGWLPESEIEAPEQEFVSSVSSIAYRGSEPPRVIHDLAEHKTLESQGWRIEVKRETYRAKYERQGHRQWPAEWIEFLESSEVEAETKKLGIDYLTACETRGQNALEPQEWLDEINGVVE
jgi:hypothetical protein